MNPKQSIVFINKCHNGVCHEHSCTLLLNLPMLEDNSAYLNFLVCRNMPWPLRIYSLFFFISSETISGMNISINKYQLGRWKRGNIPLAKL